MDDSNVEFNKLPEDLQDAIFSDEVFEAMKSIGKKYGLLIDKIGYLADESNLVMKGETSPEYFIPNLVVRLEVDKKTAYEIAKDVNEQVFSKVRESLKKIHGIKDDNEQSGNGENLAMEKREMSQPAAMKMAPRLDEKPLEKTVVKEEIVSADLTPKISVEKKVEQIWKNKEPVVPKREEKPSPFEAKVKEDVFRAVPSKTEYKEVGESKIMTDATARTQYPHGDPYREPIE